MLVPVEGSCITPPLSFARTNKPKPSDQLAWFFPAGAAVELDLGCMGLSGPLEKPSDPLCFLQMTFTVVGIWMSCLCVQAVAVTWGLSFLLALYITVCPAGCLGLMSPVQHWKLQPQPPSYPRWALSSQQEEKMPVGTGYDIFHLLLPDLCLLAMRNLSEVKHSAHLVKVSKSKMSFISDYQTALRAKEKSVSMSSIIPSKQYLFHCVK